MKATSVFKWLILTFVLVTIPFLCIEYVNIATSSPLLKNNIRKSLQSACDFYSAETYISSNASKYNLPNLVNSSNGAFVSGSFYGNLSANSIYNKIMDSFRQDIVNARLPRYLGSATTPQDTQPASWYIENLSDYVNGTHQAFNNNKITPANMGVTHINEDIVLKMFKYNLASTLIKGDTVNLTKDGNKNVARFNGFEVDIDNISIDVQHAITYIGSPYYELATGLDSSKLDNSGGVGGVSHENVIIAEISYSVPVRYTGITPMKRAMEWIWDNDRRVHGTSDTKKTYRESTLNLNDYDTINSDERNLNLIDKVYYTIVN